MKRFICLIFALSFLSVPCLAFNKEVVADGYIYDGYGYYESYHSVSYFPIVIIVALVIGVIFALIMTSKLKHELQSVEKATRAANYVQRESFVLKSQQDVFVNKSVTRIPINNGNNSRGGRPGGGNSGRQMPSGRPSGNYARGGMQNRGPSGGNTRGGMPGGRGPSGGPGRGRF